MRESSHATLQKTMAGMDSGARELEAREKKILAAVENSGKVINDLLGKLQSSPLEDLEGIKQHIANIYEIVAFLHGQEAFKEMMESCLSLLGVIKCKLKESEKIMGARSASGLMPDRFKAGMISKTFAYLRKSFEHVSKQMSQMNRRSSIDFFLPQARALRIHPIFEVKPIVGLISGYFEDEDSVYQNQEFCSDLSFLPFSSHIAVWGGGDPSSQGARCWYSSGNKSGVTWLITRLCKGDFSNHHYGKGGCAFKLNMFRVVAHDDNYYAYNEDTPYYMRIKIIVFDLTQPHTLAWAKNIIADRKHPITEKDVIFLVGTKKDLPDADEALSRDANTFAVHNGIKHILVSSKTGENIETLKEMILETILDLKFPNRDAPAPSELDASAPSKSGCAVM
jgi:hypothetical protein